MPDNPGTTFPLSFLAPKRLRKEKGRGERGGDNLWKKQILRPLESRSRSHSRSSFVAPRFSASRRHRARARRNQEEPQHTQPVLCSLFRGVVCCVPGSSSPVARAISTGEKESNLGPWVNCRRSLLSDLGLGSEAGQDHKKTRKKVRRVLIPLGIDIGRTLLSLFSAVSTREKGKDRCHQLNEIS